MEEGFWGKWSQFVIDLHIGRRCAGYYDSASTQVFVIAHSALCSIRNFGKAALDSVNINYQVDAGPIWFTMDGFIVA